MYLYSECESRHKNQTVNPPIVDKMPSNTGRRIILSVITLLYTLCMGTGVIQLYFQDLAIVTNGDTRASILASTLGANPSPLYALFNFFYFATFLVSDGLLVRLTDISVALTYWHRNADMALLLRVGKVEMAASGSISTFCHRIRSGLSIMNFQRLSIREQGYLCPSLCPTRVRSKAWL